MLGAVLAGGTSRRYGRDKASVVVGGRPLAARAAETLSEVCEAVVIIGSAGPEVTAWPRTDDLRPGLGPVAGIEAALEQAWQRGMDAAFVLACDLPLVTPTVVEAILASRAGHRAAAPRGGAEAGIEPLCAVYDRSCLPAVRDALDRGSLSARRLFEALGGRTVPMSPEYFLNVNRPADRLRAEAALEQGDT